MFKAFNKLHRTSNFEFWKSKFGSNYVEIRKKSFGTEKSSGATKEKSQTHSCKHQEAFKNLQSKINTQETHESLKKFAIQNTVESFKQKIYESFHFKQDKTQKPDAPQESINIPTNSFQSAQKQENNSTIRHETLKSEEIKIEIQKQSFQEKMNTVIADTPVVGKMVDYMKESWDQTFPKDKFQMKTAEVKKKAKDIASKKQREYTEEELERIQAEIPQWKRTALIHLAEEMQERKTIKRQMIDALKEKVNQTKVAQDFYQSEEYKDIQDFKKEMYQFKEDWKDHMHHSQNPAVIASIAVYSKITSESNTARAIQEMKNRMPGFDIYELERDAKGVFCQIYDAFLEGNLPFIEKTCGESALVYFRTLLKKREVEGVYPKYMSLWDADVADLIGGRAPAENNHPCFTFTIRVQEIYCNLNKKTNQVVDGSEDRVMQNRYNFVLTMHDNPDFGLSGHPWELIEILPVEAVHMLA